MKKLIIVFIILIFGNPIIWAQTTLKKRYLKPVNSQEKLATKIGDKTRSYYVMDTENASVINVDGPGKLRILSRCRFMRGQNDKLSYQIIYAVDGGQPQVISFNSVIKSSKATYLDRALGVPGQLKDFEIILGRGAHTIKFLKGGQNFQVAARYSFTPTKAKKKVWIAYSPLQPSQPVDLISRESNVCYYRFSKEKPLRVAINGPTELRVLTRIENHFAMRGRILYRIQVSENNKVINTYQLSSVRSEVSMYAESTDLIPGKACEFVINVPKGRHTYEILPLDKDKNTVLGRCLFPKKDVSLEE
ncbi:MAG: hypothetical protein K9G76_02880 [Bacteroidales bacterium]|nr:hypothetical protein [Bacteroidales bacterium]MCF8402738.1 hypothetical protein [Bacteroidales bacterium]